MVSSQWHWYKEAYKHATFSPSSEMSSDHINVEHSGVFVCHCSAIIHNLGQTKAKKNGKKQVYI